MDILIKKKEGESSSALMYRFSKKVKQSGIIKEVKKRRFHNRPVSKIKRRSSAIHKAKRVGELEEAKKMGLL